jgi:hypothetical protein
MTHKFMPCRIFVTTSPSCYDIQKGLRIQETKRFKDFCQQLYNVPITMSLNANELSIEGGNYSLKRPRGVDIQLVRTLRLLEGAKAYDLLAGLGPFPLTNSLLYWTTLPPSIREKGGILVLMLQREAM